MRSAGFRRLDGGESAEVRARTRSAFRKLGIPVALAVIGPAAAFGTGFLFHGEGPEPPVIVMLLMFAVGFLLPAAALLLFRDYVKNWRNLRRDRKKGVVELFSAPDRPAGPAPAGDASPDGIRIADLEVLPRSGLVFRMNGARPGNRMTVAVYESAPAPSAPLSYSLRADMANDIPPEFLERADITRRPLNAGELEELRQHVRRLRQPSWAFIGVLAWSSMGCIAALGSYARGEFTSWAHEYGILFLFCAAVTVLKAVEFVKTRLVVRELDLDRMDGWALVVAEKSEDVKIMEVLPGSGMVWTVSGVPPEWRLTKAGRKIT